MSYPALSCTGLAGMLNDLTGTSTLIAGSCGLHRTERCTLCDAYLTGTVTNGAGLDAGALFGTRAAAIGAVFNTRDLYLFWYSP